MRVKPRRGNIDFFPARRGFSRSIHELLLKSVQKTKNVIFTGLEPTLNNSLIEYIKDARALGYSCIRLITNGRRLSYFEYAQALVSSRLNEIIISLHGSGKRFHDLLTRTPGSFEQTIQACRNLEVLEPAGHFIWRIHITLNSINAVDLPDLLALALSFQTVTSILVNAVIPEGNGLTYLNQLSANYSELADSFKNAVKTVQQNKKMPLKARLSIVGLPVCLFGGFEHLVGGFEPTLFSDKKGVSIQKRSPKRIKGKRCPACKHKKACEGVWEPYIKVHGWKEFNPVI